MRWTLPALLSLAFLAQSVTPSAAPAQSPPIDLNALPGEIKDLKWRDIELAAASPLERCRSLLFLNATLDEMGAQLAADEDLMSQYIDDKNLGALYVRQPPLDNPAPLEPGTGQKIALALLRGPMAGSTYATELADTPAAQLPSIEQMTASSCRAKWDEMANTRMQVRSMVHFLRAQGKMDDYDAWTPTEIKRRTAERDKAQQPAPEPQGDADARDAERQRRIKELQMIEAQQKAVAQMQMSMSYAQSGLYQDTYINTSALPGDPRYPRWYYGGISGSGFSSWYRDPGYRALALSNYNRRFYRWHGLR